MKRRDILFAWISEIIVSLFWFSPIHYWLYKKQKQFSEMATDQSSYELNDQAIEYSEALIQLEKSKFEKTPKIVSSIGIAENPSLLKLRIESIMKNKLKKPSTILMWALISIMVLGTSVSCSFDNNAKPLTIDPSLELTVSQAQPIINRADDILNSIDTLDFDQMWANSSEYFKSAISKEQLRENVLPAHEQLGEIKNRTLLKINSVASKNTVPGGKNIHLEYGSIYESGTWSEHLYMIREADGVWRVTGHWVR